LTERERETEKVFATAAYGRWSWWIGGGEAPPPPESVGLLVSSGDKENERERGVLLTINQGLKVGGGTCARAREREREREREIM
jgi:hypothetical protein